MSEESEKRHAGSDRGEEFLKNKHKKQKQEVHFLKNIYMCFLPEQNLLAYGSLLSGC